MSEKIRLESGPLDITREVCGVLGRLDLQLAEKPLARDEIEDMARMVKLLEWQMPLIGGEVAVMGEILEADNEAYVSKSKFALPSLIHPTFGEKAPSLKGIYQGFSVLPVINEKGDRRRRILHKIRTGTDDFYTPSADQITITNFKYACVADSTIRPLEPVNAHSAVDLYGDEDVEEINNIVRKTPDQYMQIMKVGGYINEVLHESRGDWGPDFQLVSFANSILPKGYVATNDFIKEAIGSGGDFRWCGLSPKQAFTYIQAGNLAILNAYERTQANPNDVKVLDYPELYIRGVDRRATIPLRSVVGMR